MNKISIKLTLIVLFFSISCKENKSDVDETKVTINDRIEILNKISTESEKIVDSILETNTSYSDFTEEEIRIGDSLRKSIQ